jgi:hypothetical protein
MIWGKVRLAAISQRFDSHWFGCSCQSWLSHAFNAHPSGSFRVSELTSLFLGLISFDFMVCLLQMVLLAFFIDGKPLAFSIDSTSVVRSSAESSLQQSLYGLFGLGFVWLSSRLASLIPCHVLLCVDSYLCASL